MDDYKLIKKTSQELWDWYEGRMISFYEEVERIDNLRHEGHSVRENLSEQYSTIQKMFVTALDTKYKLTMLGVQSCKESVNE